MHPAPDTDPSDTSLLSVLRQFDADGHTGQFQAVEGATLRCLTCHRDSPAQEVDADRIVRLEGASDPADMLAVIPVTCPHCGTAGTLVANFGPEATVEEADLLIALDRTPQTQATDHDHPAA